MGLTILGGAIASTAAVCVTAVKTQTKAASLFYEASAGILFALGLGFSEMTRPSKVPCPP